MSVVGPTQTFRNVGSYVGCSGWSGLVMLNASFSGCDPTETLAVHCTNGFQPLSKCLSQSIQGNARGLFRGRLAL